MKRRSGALSNDGSKWRRPMMRRSQTKGLSGDSLVTNSLIYIKLLILWSLVLSADYIIDFRFEYLWPFWLFLRSVYDSFKYQGMAFSVFFVCIALTSDMICFLFIPVHWLFFAASTYVWVQYVWHTEKGVCLPTVCLWLLLVYIEASVRLREFRAHVDIRHLPFHLDLCRPFAAHCIGYPVVTLGFGFKSYVGYRMRQRRQREVERENESYFEYCRHALPPGSIRNDAFNPNPSTNTGVEASTTSESVSYSCSSSWNEAKNNSNNASQQDSIHHRIGNGGLASSSSAADMLSAMTSVEASNGDVDQSVVTPSSHKKSSKSGGGGGTPGSNASNNKDSSSKDRGNKDRSKESGGSKTAHKEDQVAKMEADLRRLKIDLQLSRNKENELRDQIVSYMSSERHLKSEISNLQVEKSLLESRLSTMSATRSSEKAALANLEKKLAEERKQKTDFQIKLESERKVKKEVANAERNAQHNATKNEVIKLEAELKTLRAELVASRERCQAAEQDAFALRKYKEAHGDPELLVSALKALQDKNKQIEKSLSAETKLKMDLFSALGDAKREVDIKQNLLSKKEREIVELKAKIAEVLAVMPTSSGLSVAAPTVPPVSTINSFAPTTLALDLPTSTDLSFTGKLASFDNNNMNNAAATLFGAHSPGGLAANAFAAAKTNGAAHDC